jgi:hypothetical protein
MPFLKIFFTNILRICSSLFTKKIPNFFYFLKKFEFEFLNSENFE